MEIAIVAIVFGSMIAIFGIIFSNVTKWKQMKTLSPEGEASLTELRDEAEKIEQRLRSLERILDAEIPDWRHRYDD